MVWAIGIHGSNENCGSRFTLVGIATNESSALSMFEKIKESMTISETDESYEMYEIEENKILDSWIG